MVWLPFGRKQDGDFESVLAGLETRIKERETHLLSIKLRERRANVLALTYGIGACAVYFVLWYFRVVGASKDDGSWQKMMATLPLLVGPALVIFARRILGFWFHRQEAKEETALRALKKQQRDKVEELKKKTGYYSTRDLLEKYDEGIKRGADARSGQPARPGNMTPQSNRTPVRNASPMTPGSKPMASGPSTPAAGTPVRAAKGSAEAELPLLPPAASTPPRRTWMDRVADALLGVADEGGPNSKYALICQKCFAHNGLVPKEQFDSIQYTCPRCGFFNAKKSKENETETSLGSRRTKSLHVPNTSRLSQSFSSDANNSSDEDTESKEGGTVLMKEKKENETPLRRRVEAMDVDS